MLKMQTPTVYLQTRVNVVFMLSTSQAPPPPDVIKVYVKAKVVVCVSNIPCHFEDHNLLTV